MRGGGDERAGGVRGRGLPLSGLGAGDGEDDGAEDDSVPDGDDEGGGGDDEGGGHGVMAVNLLRTRNPNLCRDVMFVIYCH